MKNVKNDREQFTFNFFDLLNKHTINRPAIITRKFTSTIGNIDKIIIGLKCFCKYHNIIWKFFG